MRRFRHLLASLAHFESGLMSASTLVIVDDCGMDIRTKIESETLGFKKVVILKNPYAGSDAGKIVHDRLIAGVLLALRHILDLEGYDFVLKMDTDALVIAPFGDRIKAFLAANPRAGMVGSFRHDPDGKLRSSEAAWWARHIRKTCGNLPSGLIRLRRRYWVPIRPALVFKRWRRRRELIREASRNGWGEGDNILGGAYALSPLMVDALRAKRELLADIALFDGTGISEDVGLSLLVLALGFQLAEYNQQGGVFGVWYQQPTLPAEALLSRGYALVHSIKADDTEKEAALRAEVCGAAGMKTQ